MAHNIHDPWNRLSQFSAKSFLLLATFISCAIISWQSFAMLDRWSPIGDDYALLDRTEHSTPSELITTSWRGLFDSGEESEGVQSDLYRPLLDLSFWADQHLLSVIPGFRAIYTNIAILLLLSVVAAMFFRGLLGNGWAALVSMTIFTLHASHSDTLFSLANRSDPLASLILLIGVISLMAFARRGWVGWRGMFHLCVALALLTKETAVIGVAMPCIIAAISRKQGWIYERRAAILDTLIVIGTIGAYFMVRYVFFHGIGRYGSVTPGATDLARNGILIFYYLLFGNEYDIHTSMLQIPLILPLLLLLGYFLIRSIIRPLPAILIGLLTLFLSAPALPCSSGKRFVIFSLLAVTAYCAIIGMQLGSSRHRRLFSAAVVLFIAAQVVQWGVIKREFRYVFNLKAHYDSRLSTAAIGSDTVYIILPNNCGANAWLFSNRVDRYLSRFAPFRSKTIIPLAYVADKISSEPCSMWIERANNGTLILHASAKHWFFRPIRAETVTQNMQYVSSRTEQRANPHPTDLTLRSLAASYDLIYPVGQDLRIVQWRGIPSSQPLLVSEARSPAVK